MLRIGKRPFLWGPLLLMAAAFGVFVLASRGQSSAPPAPGKVLKAFNVGGVLTADGTLWEYRPDRGSWMTIDAAFRDQGKETHILPLPVPATAVREMITFGFLVTEAGDCWLYNIDKDAWEKLPPPGGR